MKKILNSFLPVRFNDCDPFGHLNNAAYFNYFINARMDQVNDEYKDQLRRVYNSKKNWVVSKHEIKYMVPAFPQEIVCIKSLLLDYTKDSLIVEMTMWDEQVTQLKAILWSTFTHISLTTGKKENHDEKFMALLSEIKIGTIDINNGLESRIEEIKSSLNGYV